ncbi:MAG: hypothetical protein Q8N96_01965 [Methylovulum sp.]|nr:hypothetical protein [Methylovulum sp.]
MSTKKQEKGRIDNPDSVVNKSRRKISKAGLGIPILLSLPGKALWAGSCGYSGLLSGNLSGPDSPRNCAKGSGMSPGYWRNNEGIRHWPSAYPITTKFNDVFTGRHIKISTDSLSWDIPDPLLLEALNAHERGVFALSTYSGSVSQYTGNTDLKYQVWHAICALLNAASFPHFGYPSASFTTAGVIADFQSGNSAYLDKYVALEDVGP